MELIFADEIESFVWSPDSGEVEMVFSASAESASVGNAGAFGGLLLPLRVGGAELEAQGSTSDAGVLYRHEAVLELRAADVTDALLRVLRRIERRGGCVLVATTNNGARRMFGSAACPLRGTMQEVYGRQAASLHELRLSLSASCLHAELVPVV